MPKGPNNWGRWGPDDQIGALNLLGPEAVLKAIGLVNKGKVYNLAVPLERDGPQAPSFQKTWRVTYYLEEQSPARSLVSDDVVTMMTHSGTHIDALGHYAQGGKMWNGHDQSPYADDGLRRAAIDQVSSIVGRGVMLDVAALRGVEYLDRDQVVAPEDLDACAHAQGVRVQSGDVLLLHTGWYRLFERDRTLWEQGEPGPDASLAEWLKANDIVAVGADNVGVEAKPGALRQETGASLHLAALRNLGVYLLENVNLDELVRDKVYEFLFVGAPLRLTGATGSPLTPLAIV